MKTIFIFVMAFFIIFNASNLKVIASEEDSNLNESQIIIANKYADRFCSSKNDNYFKGLDSEKTLKYSYFKYIGLQSKEIYSKEIYEEVIRQIKETCNLTKKEESEINEFYFNKSIPGIKLSK